MIENYSGYFIPIMPEKNFFTKLNIESQHFQEKRRSDLEQFLNKILEHEFLKNTPELWIFVSDNNKNLKLLIGSTENNKSLDKKLNNFVDSCK